MSERFARFCLKHRAIGKLIMFFAYVIPLSVIFYIFNASVGVYIAVFAFIAVITSLMMSTVPAVLTVPALKRLNDECDPYPLLETSEEILKYVKKSHEQLTATLNRCSALSHIGRHQENLDCLKAIAIDSYNGLPATLRYVYYHNLADALLTSGDKEAAEWAFEKSKECFAAVKNKKLITQFADSMNFMQVELCIENGENERALELIKGVDTTTVARSVTVAYLSAKINIGLGLTDRAKTDLEYVIATGNKLCSVAEAQELLEKIA